MKIFEVKHGKYQKVRLGCDYCGEPKQAVGYKNSPQGNFNKIYLCRDCWDIVKQESN